MHEDTLARVNYVLTMSAAAAAEGAPQRCIDWHKAAELIRERKPQSVDAGLREDWSSTGGTIVENGEPLVDSGGGYFSSNWATPVLLIDDEWIDCWCLADEAGWNAKTRWPESALAILRGAP